MGWDARSNVAATRAEPSTRAQGWQRGKGRTSWEMNHFPGALAARFLSPKKQENLGDSWKSPTSPKTHNKTKIQIRNSVEILLKLRLPHLCFTVKQHCLPNPDLLLKCEQSREKVSLQSQPPGCEQIYPIACLYLVDRQHRLLKWGQNSGQPLTQILAPHHPLQKIKIYCGH